MSGINRLLLIAGSELLRLHNRFLGFNGEIIVGHTNLFIVSLSVGDCSISNFWPVEKREQATAFLSVV
jgi:hypothetical protein